jgi:hypothetical protein
MSKRNEINETKRNDFFNQNGMKKIQKQNGTTEKMFIKP